MSAVEPATVHEPTRRKRRRPRLSDEVAAHVRELIISGQLTAGEFIRPETVAQELDISAKRGGRASSRCRARASSRCNPGAGFLVSPLSAQDIHDTFAAQALLAGELAARAAVVATPVGVRALEDLQTGLDAATERGDYDQVEQLNFEFHHHLPAGPGPKISWLLGATLRYSPRELFAAVPGWPEASAHDHHAVLTALGNLDGEAARAAMSKHVTGAGALLAEHLARPRGMDR